MTDTYSKPLVERVVKLEADRDHIRRKVDEIHKVLVTNGLIASVSKNTLFRNSRQWFERLLITVLVVFLLPALLGGVWYVATHYAVLNP